MREEGVLCPLTQVRAGPPAGAGVEVIAGLDMAEAEAEAVAGAHQRLPLLLTRLLPRLKYLPADATALRKP